MRLQTAWITRRRLVPCFAGLLSLLLVSCPAPIGEDLLLQMRDEIGPVITINSPEDGSSCSQTVVVTGVAEDPTGTPGEPGGVGALWFEVPGSEVSGTGIVEADGVFSFQFPTTDLGPSFVLTVNAEDWSGNRSSVSITLKRIEGNDIPSFTAVPGNHSVTLSWDDVPLASGYTLYYTDNGSMPSAQYGTTIENVTKPYALTDLKNGSRHVFVLQAHSTDGPDNWSEPVETIPLSSFTLAPRVTGEYGQIAVEWCAIPGTDTFEVWRATAMDDEYINISGLIQRTHYEDLLVENNVVYYYCVTTPLSDAIVSEANCAITVPFPNEFNRIVGSYPTRPAGNANGVTIVGDRAYVAAGAAGLLIFDIIAPASPVLLGAYDTDGTAHAVAVDAPAQLAYVADGHSGLLVLDIANPGNITSVGALTTLNALDVKINGSYAYIADTGYLDVVDITTPASPFSAGSFCCQAYGLDVNGTTVYVSGYEDFTILDVTDPAPSLLGWCDLPGGGGDVVLLGSYALVSDYDKGLHIIDISEPASPKLDPPDGASYDTPGIAGGIAVSGDRVFVADYSAGLHMLDVSDPLNPLLIRSFDTPGAAADVAITNEYAVVADGAGGLQVVDLSDPPPPVPVSSWEASSPFCDMELRGNSAYMAHYSGWLLLDFSTPSSPDLVESYDTPGSCVGLDVCGKYVVIADGEHGLELFDTSLAAEHALIGTYDSLANARAVLVIGDYAYVADEATGLNVIDISDPANPSLTAVHPTIGVPYTIAAYGHHLLVTDSGLGLEVFDVSSPESPSLIATVEIEDSRRMFVTGDTAYVCGHDQVQILDLSDPSDPQAAGILEVPNASGVVSASGYVFAAAGSSGWQIHYTGGPSEPFLAGASVVPDCTGGITMNGGLAFVIENSWDPPFKFHVFDIFPDD